MRLNVKSNWIGGLAVVFGLISAPLHADQLAGSEWGPVDIADTPLIEGSDVFVRFEQDGTYAGNGGCNQMFGRYVTNEGAILFGPAGATMMFCEEPVNVQERAFVSGLFSARGFVRSGTELELMDASETVVMRLIQRDAD